MATFISSNLDNFLLLLGLMGNYSQSRREVLTGYLINILLVTVVALIFSYFIELFPIQFLKYLGIIPITLGIYQLLKLFNCSSSKESMAQLESVNSKIKIMLTVFGIMLANSGDTFAVFLAFMSDTQKGLRWIIVVTALVMGLLWGVIAKIFLNNPRLLSIIKLTSKYILPFILILIGCYILTDSPTDSESILHKFNEYKI